MVTKTKKPYDDGFYQELTPQGSANHWENVLTDDGGTTGNFNSTHPSTKKDTYKISVPPNTTKIEIFSITNDFSGIGNASMKNILRYGGVDQEGPSHALTGGWMTFSDEFVGFFSGDVDIGVSLNATDGLVMTTQVYAICTYTRRTLVDRLVDRHGETVIHKKITVAVYDVDEPDDYNPDTSISVNTEIKAIISRPSARRVVKLMGKEFDADLAITVDHNYDILATRDGIPDLVFYDDHWYTVNDIHNSRHPFVPDNKKLVLLEL